MIWIRWNWKYGYTIPKNLAFLYLLQWLKTHLILLKLVYQRWFLFLYLWRNTSWFLQCSAGLRYWPTLLEIKKIAEDNPWWSQDWRVSRLEILVLWHSRCVHTLEVPYFWAKPHLIAYNKSLPTISISSYIYSKFGWLSYWSHSIRYQNPRSPERTRITDYNCTLGCCHHISPRLVFKSFMRIWSERRPLSLELSLIIFLTSSNPRCRKLTRQVR